MLKKKFLNWFESSDKSSESRIDNIDIINLKKWKFENKFIYHESKRFFKIKFYKILSKFIKKKISYSPFIEQKEVGILGIIVKKFKKGYKYLLQAKFEPGNINKIQISPTVQATKSNYTKVHKGKKVNFIDLFFTEVEKKNYIFNAKLPEQGTRYVNKFNQNITIEVKSKKLNIPNNFLWVSKQEIHSLLKKNNLINMDTLSVLSCIVKKETFDVPLNSIKKIKDKIKFYNNSHKIKIISIELKKLMGWRYQNKKIINLKKEYFSIIGIRTTAKSREIKIWDQPILKEYHKGIVGFIVKKINNSLHYYMQIVKEPGHKKSLLTSSICIKNFSIKHYKNNFFMNLLKKKNSSKILFNKILSEEGGRFFHKQNKNIVIELKKNVNIPDKKNFIWVSHNQMVDLIKKGIISIEARNLFVSYNIKKIL